MIDFILGAYIAGLAVRGWLRGMIREVLDLVGLVAGVALAFRLSRPVGDFLTDRFGITSEWARVGGGALLFVGLGLILAIVARALSGLMRLPGLNLVNRIGGAVVSTAWGALLLAVLVTIAGVFPIPGIKQSLAGSRIAEVLAGPDSIATGLIGLVGGETVGSAITSLERLVGGRRVVVDGDERIDLDPVDDGRFGADAAAAAEMLTLLNATRLEAGAAPLPWSEELAAVATAHAEEMYTDGYVSGVSHTTGRAPDRVEDAGLRLTLVTENIGLATTTRAVHQAFVDSAAHRGRMISGAVHRVGIGVVAGPYGLMVVEVFAN